MRDESKRLKNGLLAIADQIVVSAGTFLSGMIICRNTSEADFGSFCLAWSVISFLRVLQERMIAAPYLAFTFRASFDRKSYRGSSIFHQTLFAIFTSVIFLFVSVVGWLLGYGAENLLHGTSLAVALFLNLARDQMRAISFTDFTFLRLVLLDIAIVVTQVTWLLLLVWLDMFSLISANFLIGFGCIGPVAVWLWLTKSLYSFELKTIASDWYQNWSYAQWLVGSRILGIAPLVIVPLVIVQYEGQVGNGIYGVCCSLVGVSAMFANGLNNLFQSRTVLEMQRSGTRGMLFAVAESAAVVGTVLTCLSVVFLFYGGVLLNIFGSQYVQFGFLTFLLSVSTLVVNFSTMFSNGLAALKKSRDFFWGEVSCGVVSIASALLLVPIYGLHGAAYATILGGFATTLITGLTLARGVRIYQLHSDYRTVAPSSATMKSK